MREEIELDKNSANITLPTAARFISATMLGTITKKGEREKFIQGVYSFPTLDNPVWYVTEKDLQHIFDDKEEADIEYDKYYYLPIGNSPAFPSYKVKICPDQFFVKHAAILGNTGSGKSCTFTSIIRNLFKYDYAGKKLENAHFIIFDTNGEYRDAFLPTAKQQTINNADRSQLEFINAYYYGGVEKVKVPYWYMNWDEFRYLLKPSEGTQAPVLNRAIGLAKNKQECKEQSILPSYLGVELFNILNSTHEELKKRTGYNDYGNWLWKGAGVKVKNNAVTLEDNEIVTFGKEIEKYHSQLGNLLIQLGSKNVFNNAEMQGPIRKEIQTIFNEINQESQFIQITSEQNVDTPIWFSYMELCAKFIDAAIEQEGRTNARISEYLSTLRLRMRSFLNDKRMAIPLMLKDTTNENKEILAKFIAFLLGDFNRYFKDQTTESFIQKYNTANVPKHPEKTSQITIIDTSQLPFEVLETITALLGRLIIEFVSYFKPEERGKYPIVIVLEEAQNYIAEKQDSVAKNVFERIAREGRKYGVSLIVCSQRPSELSKTVLSQCNSFVIHRLQNPEDQTYIKGLVSSANADILDQLPIIPQQNAIITGDCVRTPIHVHIDDVDPTPNSHNPKFIESWLRDDLAIPYEKTCERWCNLKEKIKEEK